MKKLLALLVCTLLFTAPAAVTAKDVFGYIKNMAGKTVDSAAEMLVGSDMVLNLVNGYVKRYAVVKKISKKGGTVSCTVLPKGSKELIDVTAKKIVFANDNSTVTINDLSANVEWLNNSLKDFVQGKPYTIPRENREIVGQVKKLF